MAEARVRASQGTTLHLLLDWGHQAVMVRVAIRSPDEEGYLRSELRVVDDWR